MTFELGYLFVVVWVYLSALFLIAYATDRGWIPQAIVYHPLTYVLSLGVYTTSWSYYGSVGFAEQQGLLFLTIYIGPTLTFILTPVLLSPLLKLIRDYQLTSLADLFAFRYSSQLAGILVTVFMLAGTLPYIALQIRAVTESTRVLSQDTPPLELGFVFCIILTVFSILFGARHVSPREKHAGLVLAIAFESLVKLLTILSVALFALFGVFAGPTGLDDWLRQNPQVLHALYQPVQQGPWLTLIFLSFAAAFLLPRQFYMIFIENLNSRSLNTASWGFPLLLLLFNLAILPILWAGQALGAGSNSDYYTLGITLFANTPILPTIAFIGGISAASAMTIVTTLALSQMALNHVLLPASYPDPAVDMYRWLLWGRRTLIALIILTSYGVYVLLEHRGGLVQLGLISFVAVIQFLPGIIGVLFWQRATRAGFLAGLSGGALIWYIALLMPLLEQSGVILSQFDLMSFMGVADQNPWEFSTFWSLSLNTLLFVAVSLVTRHSSGERRAIAACFPHLSLPPGERQVIATSPSQFTEQLSRIIGAPAASGEVDKALLDLHMTPDEHRPRQLQQLRNRIERNLSGMLGPMLARMIVDARLQKNADTRTMLADHIRFIEDRLEQSRSRLRGLAGELDRLHRYHSQIIQELPLGACSLTVDREILNWNQAMERLSDIDRQTAMGSRIQELAAPWSDLLSAFLDQDQQYVHKTRVLIHGRPRWFNLHKAAIEDTRTSEEAEENSFTGGVVVLVEDLTEVQILEAELAHSERLASIGRLAAGVAHEVGNPVTGIACITQNLRFEDDPGIIQEGLDEILTQTERINTIVRSLITFSHASPVEGECASDFELYPCLNDAQRLVWLSRGAKNLHYRIDCDRELTIKGNQQRLLQVFVNLLNNACDASQSGDLIQVTAEMDDNEVIIIVSDSGEGIPEELQERIFEPFFTTKGPDKGTGLGLPLVYTIVREHGGTITIDSVPKQGTRITIRLPQHQTTPAQLSTTR